MQTSPRISIHAPRVGRDQAIFATGLFSRDFNPRAPCGARLQGMSLLFKCMISIHAPRVGRDPDDPHPGPPVRHFNPRAPCGARPKEPELRYTASDFNPRAPCGARPVVGRIARAAALFQSTRPVWGATHVVLVDQVDLEISIHAPRVGRDDIHRRRRRRLGDFNPRAPCGARPAQSSPAARTDSFQSTRPVWGATQALAG